MGPIAISADGLLKIYLITYGVHDEVYFKIHNGKLRVKNIEYNEDSVTVQIDKNVYDFSEILRII